MKTLRKKIRNPFLIVIISIPLAIMLLLNVSLLRIAKTEARQDLAYVASNIPKGVISENYSSIVPYIRSQLGAANVEVMVYNKLGETIQQLRNDNSILTDDLSRIIYQHIKNLPLGTIGSFSYKGDDYFIIEVEYDGRDIFDKVVYVSKGHYLLDFIGLINLLLIIISILVTSVAIMISNSVAKSIAKPIEKITHTIETLDGNEPLTINIHSDCLEITKLTDELNTMSQRISSTHLSQKTFLQNASHELRTPLMSIQGYAEGLEMGFFTDVKGTANLISTQSKRLTTIVDSLLALARVENFDAANQLKYIDISNPINDIVQEHLGYALKNDVQIITRIVPSVFAQANEELIKSAVGNILSNAIRYASSTIHFSLENLDEKIRIIIKDDGNGLENTSAIFDRFTKGQDGNYGLGLSIAKTAVEMLQGEINAYNDQGAVFVIELNQPTKSR